MSVSLSVLDCLESPTSCGVSGGFPNSSASTSVPLDTRGNKSATKISSTRKSRRCRQAVPERAVYEAARQARRGGQGRAVAGSYDAIGESERAERVRSCGRLAVYGCVDGCGVLHGRTAYHCRDRLCPYCSVLRGYQLAERVQPLVDAMDEPLFLTLTVKNGPDLRERGQHLRKGFERLRRRKYWREHVAGGIAIEEVVHKGLEWHPHLHIIVDSATSSAVLLKEIAREWKAVTGDSFIIDVRPLTELREACKYTAKLSGIVYYPDLVREFTAYAARRRMVVPFGNCYGQVAAEALAAVETETPAVEICVPEDLPCPSCGMVGGLRRVLGHGWMRTEAASVGGGWYVLCRTRSDWEAVLRARERVPK